MKLSCFLSMLAFPAFFCFPKKPYFKLFYFLFYFVLAKVRPSSRRNIFIFFFILFYFFFFILFFIHTFWFLSRNNSTADFCRKLRSLPFHKEPSDVLLFFLWTLIDDRLSIKCFWPYENSTDIILINAPLYIHGVNILKTANWFVLFLSFWIIVLKYFLL